MDLRTSSIANQSSLQGANLPRSALDIEREGARGLCGYTSKSLVASGATFGCTGANVICPSASDFGRLFVLQPETPPTTFTHI